MIMEGFNITKFKSDLLESELCTPATTTPSNLSTEQLAIRYDKRLQHILETCPPITELTCRKRSSDSWHDGECQQTWKETRKLKRHVRMDQFTPSHA